LTGRSGVAVREVDPLSPAATAVRPGLLIQKLNGRDITGVEDVERIAESLRPGQVVTIVARRPDESGSEIILNYRVR
jgi:S1-C subfamily serine protease